MSTAAKKNNMETDEYIIFPREQVIFPCNMPAHKLLLNEAPTSKYFLGRPHTIPTDALWTLPCLLPHDSRMDHPLPMPYLVLVSPSFFLHALQSGLDYSLNWSLNKNGVTPSGDA